MTWGTYFQIEAKWDFWWSTAHFIWLFDDTFLFSVVQDVNASGRELNDDHEKD